MSKMIIGLLLLWLSTMIVINGHTGSSTSDIESVLAILEAVLGTALLIWGALEHTFARRQIRDDPQRGFPVVMAKKV